MSRDILLPADHESRGISMSVLAYTISYRHLPLLVGLWALLIGRSCCSTAFTTVSTPRPEGGFFHADRFLDKKT